jgi:threonylcarbamoyladenosine tRNA methylthiotransferase MtaB
MRRRYKREVFAGRVNRIREILPSAGIGADVIVGFPGETSADFEETFSFIEQLPLTYLHVFTFSERPGTVAAALEGKVPTNEKEIRSKRLIALSEKKHLGFSSQNIGTETEVLFEKNRIAGMITGFTPNYLKAEHPWQAKLAGSIRKARLTGISHDGRITIELTNQEYDRP